MRRLLALLVVTALAACGSIQPGGSPPSPPSEEAADLAIAVSHEQVPAEGALVALVVVNASAEPFEYGVAGDLERWDGQGWVAHRRFSTGLTSWHRPGSLHGPDEEFGVQDIGLVAPPGDAGALEWVQIEALEPGWYRFSRDGAARGRFEVVAGPVDLPELPDAGDEVLAASPSAVGVSGGEIRLVASAPRANQGESIGDLQGARGDVAALARWEDGRWAAVADLDVDPDPPPPRGNSYDDVVVLPALVPGFYRLTQQAGAYGDLHGFVLVSGVLP